ncbi:hypothetical protein DSM104440_02240 [Usitatibacter palustris]|uniref:Amidohydrolase 3 domain-containing protein n=2 Tax=Usitatibacter palustris TaxID=2732487 RepID=A0A6M4H716_9PROT|nr:hypothetical protein DSM104440_02240 [Usitatibacter palustris]
MHSRWAGRILAVAMACACASASFAAEPVKTIRLLDEVRAQWATAQPARIFTARKILTGDPSHPEATAVAVGGGLVLALGSLESVTASLGDFPYDIDGRFEGKVIVPGFIDANADPVFAAIAFGSEVIAADDWKIPGRGARVARTPEQYLERIREAAAEPAARNETLFTWGYDARSHGALGREALDKASPQRAVVVWSRTGDALILNSAAIDKYAVSGDIPSDARFTGVAQETALRFIGRDLFSPRQFARGLHALREWLPAHGITTLAQRGALPRFAPQAVIHEALDDPLTTFRTYFIADGTAIFREATVAEENVLLRTQRFWTYGRGRVEWPLQQVALLAGNAADFDKAFRLYWRAEYQLHIRAGTVAESELALRILRARQAADPRPQHRTTVALPADAPPAIADELGRLGAVVSARVQGIPERPLAASKGLASITSTPAHAIQRENYIGSIKAGSYADFAILESEPPAGVTLPVDHLGIWGTVLGGRPQPAARK